MAKEKEQTENTDQDLSGVEIFRAGSYQVIDKAGNKQTVSYSPEDVKQLAENGNSLLDGKHYEAPAKLGHAEKQTVLAEAGLPAAGWVTKLYAKGGKLLADFKSVPAKLAEAIRRGRYKYVSSEIYYPEDTKRNFGDFGITGFTLRAVAFLGADIPVVKGLSPLMLAAGVDGAVTITIPVEGTMINKFAEGKEPDADDNMKPLMVHANRHPFGALVKHADDKEGDGPHMIHAVHPDGTYDTHPLHGDSMGKEKKAVPHENLTLLSESEYHKAIEFGGAGSGDYGHAGRPGSMGGSAGSDSRLVALRKGSADHKEALGKVTKHLGTKASNIKSIHRSADNRFHVVQTHSGETHMISNRDLSGVKLSEQEIKTMEEETKNFAEVESELVAERAKNKVLVENQRNEKINAFAEKYKAYGLTAALKPLYEAVAKQDISAPVKLAEGKEQSFLESFQSFAEELIKFKKVVTGEVMPGTTDGEPKSDAIKLAELPVKAYAETNHMEITGTERAIKAREYSEKNNVPYKQALLAVAALEKENK